MQEEKPFNEAELSKLQQVLCLKLEELEDVIYACTSTFEQETVHFFMSPRAQWENHHSLLLTRRIHQLQIYELKFTPRAFKV